jgi:hypothetical protein
MRRGSKAGIIVSLAALAAWCARGQTTSRAIDRVVVIKVDGLPQSLVERFAAPADKDAPPAKLPWMHNLFAQNGAVLENFYVRGLSLSAPSWDLLDTGRHLEIRGNVEYDRYTLRAYDYLNFFPFIVGAALDKRADMTGVEVLDEVGVPLLLDRFGYTERYQASQLLRRYVRWKTLPDTLKRVFTDKPPKKIFDEWQTGLSFSEGWDRQNERELIESLKDRNIRYLDFWASGYDHAGHLTADMVTQLHVLEEIDALVGRVWSAILDSPYPDSTLLVMVSDHGMNTTEALYSQGYNFVKWFGSAEGGGHHVLTNRYPESEFKVKATWNGFVDEVITPSPEPAYPNDPPERWPTAMLDLDGNERGSIALRNNTFNKLHLLLDQLARKRMPEHMRLAVRNAFFEILDGVRAEWERDLQQLNTELHALDERILDGNKVQGTRFRRFSKQEKQLGIKPEALRANARLESMKEDRRAYGEYAAAMRRLLSMQPQDLEAGKLRGEAVIPPRSLGPPNRLADLQNYAVGIAPAGLVVKADGALDLERSFRSIDYFSALSSISVRNNVQEGIGPRPVDFMAVRIPNEQLAQSLKPEEMPAGDGIWLWRSQERQALILPRAGELLYLPIARLKTEASGAVRFERAHWAAGFPLEIFEDPKLGIAPHDRAAWLSRWHTEQEWFEAVHRTRYSNGVIGLTEELLDASPTEPRPSAEQQFIARKRQLRRTDLLIIANDHWNFNFRTFNPGGNHGSFFRVSTHSVLMFTGGLKTAIPRGARVAAPYDSLSFVPTVLALMGRAEPDLPGPVIRELVDLAGP